MSTDDNRKPVDKNRQVDLFGASYGNFATRLYEEIRAETYEDDFGQTSWVTVEEHDLFLSWLTLTPKSRLLDVACGSGGPSIRIAQEIGCHVLGIDIHTRGIDVAKSLAEQQQLSQRATFQQMDAAATLPFEDKSFDAIICIDAINHLLDRKSVLYDWARLLKRGGHLLFTDPIIVTGPLTSDEIAIRSSHGTCLFVPPEENEALIELVGLNLLKKVDRTENMASIAQRWGAARERRATELKQIEGEENFDGQQTFFQISTQIAQERRLSRFAYLATRPHS